MSSVAAALGRIPSGLFIVTAALEEKRAAMLASWVMQASFEPPMVTVAVQKERDLVDWFRAGAKLAVNVISADDKVLLGKFAKGLRGGMEIFEGTAVREGVTGAVILGDALGYVEGVAEGSLGTGDHVIFGVKVEGGEQLREGEPRVHIRKNGLNY